MALFLKSIAFFGYILSEQLDIDKARLQRLTSPQSLCIKLSGKSLKILGVSRKPETYTFQSALSNSAKASFKKSVSL